MKRYGAEEMNTISKSTCISCHYTKPRDEMRQRSFSEKSGHSVGLAGNVGGMIKQGGVMKARPGNKRGSARINYRTKKQWICNECWKGRPRWITTLLKTTIFGPLYVPAYKGMEGISRVLYTITLGYFVIGWVKDICLAFLGGLRNADGLPNSRIF